MKKLFILLGIALISSCAVKKEDKPQQPVIHNGQCEDAGKKISCVWNNVAIDSSVGK